MPDRQHPSNGSTSAAGAALKSARRSIERREGVVGAEPVIAGTRISVRDVVLYWREYGDLGRIEAALGVPEADIAAALAYYQRHRGEIDEYIRQDHEAGEAIEREYDEALRSGG